MIVLEPEVPESLSAAMPFMIEIGLGKRRAALSRVEQLCYLSVLAPIEPTELQRVLELGGSVEALGYMKERLVGRLAERLRQIETGDLTVVGINRYEEGEPSPLGALRSICASGRVRPTRWAR